jgi:hypothetical protein
VIVALWWIIWAAMQVVNIVSDILSVIPIAVACLCCAWTTPAYQTLKSIPEVHRTAIDRWRYLPNWLWGNPEDGVSGQQAYIWNSGKLVPYMPDADPRWRAFCWNMRNRSSGLKWLFSSKNPRTYLELHVGSHTSKLGFQTYDWAGVNVPVFSP